jgi:hypothetical protein
VTVQVGWLALAAVLVAVGLLVLLVRRPVAPAPAPGIDPARVVAVCQQYAGLDLSGMAALCKDAGYQERTLCCTAWPTVPRGVQPEDLDR